MYYTKIGATIQKFYILAIIGICLLLVCHMIMWLPLVEEHSEYQDEIDDCDSSYCTSSKPCDDCERYEEYQESLNQQGASMWSSTLSSCLLVALAGAITYGVGCLVEAQARRTSGSAPAAPASPAPGSVHSTMPGSVPSGGYGSGPYYR